MAACLPKQPGPAVTVTYDFTIDRTVPLLAFKIFQVTTTLWYVQVSNRRTTKTVYTTSTYTLRVAALDDAKRWSKPYLNGDQTL